MVHSMTAFARVERAGSQGTLVWELRSVNHRYLEPHLRLPEALRDLEGGVREGLRQGLSRGKVECTLRLNEDSTGKPLKVDATHLIVSPNLFEAANDLVNKQLTNGGESNTLYQRLTVQKTPELL